ncbi:MAG TPA: pyruvate kinase [Candidatus Nanoarchaeia archaeon]|nr:pyruvate kinase [Candidatus Nanoarchaeia archaeon]
MDTELHVTLWPSFPHFRRFVKDTRLHGIRLNSAMINLDELHDELEEAKTIEDVPLYFDIKGRQLRVTESIEYPDHLEVVLNHPISVQTPTPVLFKAGADHVLLERVEDGNRLIFDGGPEYKVKEGESLHIRHPSLRVSGQIFTDTEIEKMAKAKAAGFTRYFLSYVEKQRDIDEFREHVGSDTEIIAKIESKRGLEYVAREYKRQEGLHLMVARGDLYVEVDKPHDILAAHKLVIAKDPEAMIGSRMLLTLMNNEVPECSDISELAWLYDIGFRRFLLCDGLCLAEKPLARAVNVFDSVRKSYMRPTHPSIYARPVSRTNPSAPYKIASSTPPVTQPTFMRRLFNKALARGNGQ